MPPRTRGAARTAAVESAERALGDPLIARHVLLQAADGDARCVGRLAKVSRIFWQGTNGSPEQDEELYLAVASSFGWGPGLPRIEHLFRLLQEHLRTCTPSRVGKLTQLDDSAKAKSLVRVLGVDWAVHVHSVDTVGGLMDEFYGAQWLNPTSRPKFVHHSDAAQAALPANEAPGGALGLVFLDDCMRDPIGALIFKLYIPRMFRQRLVLSNVPNSGPDSPVQALEVVPIFVLQQLAYVALDASELGPHLLERRGSKLEPYNTEHLKPFGTPQTPSLKLFRRFIAWSTHIDPSKGHRVLKVAGRDNWTREDAARQIEIAADEEE